MTDAEALSPALARLRNATAGLAAVAAEPRLPEAPLQPATPLPPERARELMARAAALGPWRHGPLAFEPGTTLAPHGRDAERVAALLELAGDALAGRALVVGDDDGYTAAALALRGLEVTALASVAAAARAALLADALDVDVRPAPLVPGWPDEVEGPFDVVHWLATGRQGLQLGAMPLLERVRGLLGAEGVLVLLSPTLRSFARSQLARQLVEPDGGITWLHGRTALRGMVEAAGFEVVARREDVPLADLPPDTTAVYLLARPAESAPGLG